MGSPHITPRSRRSHRRVGTRDRIVGPAQALALVRRTITAPRRDETIVLLLDPDRRGVGLVSVAGTARSDDVVEVVELLTAPTAHAGRADAIVVASVWAGVEPVPAGAGRGDLDRWFELSEVAEQHGVVLLDWFVLDDRIRCRRVDVGAPSRW